MKDKVLLRHCMRYGLISGGIIFFILLSIYIFGMMNNDSVTWPTGIVYIGGAFLSARKYRDNYLEGKIDFKQAYLASLITFLFISLVWGLYSYFLYAFLSPELLKEQLLESQDALMDLGFSEDMVAEATTNSKISAIGAAFGTAFWAAFFGAIFSLMIAALLHRKGNLLISKNKN